jgi:hypothetical protein
VEGLLLVGGRLFPEGLTVSADVELPRELVPTPSPVLANRLVLGLHVDANPAFFRAGPGLRLEPAAFAELVVRAQGTSYFGSFDTVAPCEAGFVHGRDEAASQGPGLGWRADGLARLKGRAGPVVAVVDGEARRHEVTGPAGEFTWFWESTELLVTPAHGWTVHANAYLLGEADAGWRAGFWGTWDASPGAADENLRLGVLATVPTPGPEVIVGAQAWLRSRFLPMFPPYIVLAARWRISAS